MKWWIQLSRQTFVNEIKISKKNTIPMPSLYSEGYSFKIIVSTDQCQTPKKGFVLQVAASQPSNWILWSSPLVVAYPFWSNVFVCHSDHIDILLDIHVVHLKFPSAKSYHFYLCVKDPAQHMGLISDLAYFTWDLKKNSMSFSRGIVLYAMLIFGVRIW